MLKRKLKKIQQQKAKKMMRKSGPTMVSSYLV
jgi:hypothetical protein